MLQGEERAQVERTCGKHLDCRRRDVTCTVPADGEKNI